MSQFLAHHPMENFFINPTMSPDNSMETFARVSIMDDSPSKLRLSHRDGYIMGKSHHRTTNTVHDLFLAHEFRTSYSSEEESASSQNSEDDAASLPSSDDEFDFDDEIPEIHTATYARTPIDHRLLRPERAQAVVVKHIGRPKMVSLTKVADHHHNRHGQGHHKRLAHENFSRPSPRREDSRKSARSVQQSIRFVDEPRDSVMPTPEYEGNFDLAASYEDVEVYDESGLPTIMVTASGNDQTVKRAVTVSGMASRQGTDVHGPSSRSPAKRGLQRIASTISSASSMVRRKSSGSSIHHSVVSTAPTTPLAMPSPKLSLHLNRDPLQMPMQPIPERSSSTHKLEPRGATERAPVLVLPPFPGAEDDEEDDDFGDASDIRGMQKWDRPRARHAPAKIRKRAPIVHSAVGIPF